jgi:hypothetical protein
VQFAGSCSSLVEEAEGVVPARECGEHAFGARVTPHHDLLGGRFAMRLLAWH